MLCDRLPATQAAEWGLINWAVPEAELDAKVDAVVESLARKLPQTMRYTKQQLNWWRDISEFLNSSHASRPVTTTMLDAASSVIRNARSSPARSRC